MSALQGILNSYRQAAVSEREKGTYFEELIYAYLRNEGTYRDLYSDVWTYSDWAKAQGLDRRDTGIDLVAKTQGTNEFHAIQCKQYSEDYRVQKKDIDSFFTASGKKPFTHRIIVSTTNNWSEHAEDSLRDQQPPVSKIDLFDLENSQIDWGKYKPNQPAELKPRKILREHQSSALAAVRAGLKNADRGKMIMACGTGKTFTSLKIAESLAGRGKRVLFLVPGLALLSQTLTEWTQESEAPLHSFAVCSDSDVGKKRKQDDDSVQTFTHELRYPATTDAARLATEMAKRHDDEHMSVVFSTYHSIDVISKAQKDFGLADFDLIVCDEAHRTTGATFDDADESNFVKVHANEFIRASKRLYMTATPRIYGDTAKASAERDNVALCSMDDESLYGKQIYLITFSDAVKRGLLVDYKVIVLSIEEAHVSRRIQSLLKDENNQLKVDDAAKIVGCWKALSKQGLDSGANDDHPMKRAVAFCQVIEIQKGAKTHKVSSKNIAGMFQAVVEAYQESSEDNDAASQLACEAEHVDGGMNASQKEEKLAWLKAEIPEDTCRILSNVRCLSEGVDVPALDAVLFLTPRNSQVDVVQSVGRVMRISPGKQRGYIVLPVVIPAGVEPHEALSDNQTYRVVWQVLQALRSHDDRFDAMINKLDLIGKDTSKMEVVAVTDAIQKKSAHLRTSKEKHKAQAKGRSVIGEDAEKYKAPEQAPLPFEIGEIERAIYAKLVQKVGNRHHWEDWANDIARIAQTHIDRIKAILEDEANTRERATFFEFAKELRDDLNDSLTDGDIVEMLAQHLITKPVFDALFEKYAFAKHNPMSRAMQSVLDVLHEHRLEKEADTLQAFYDSVKLRAEGIDNAAGKQKIIVELYEKFFRNAFPKMAERLGIVYTPVEVVDFIIHSVNHILKTEFGESLGSKAVHILDPFVGTGTFITRLMQSGLISPEQLKYKYRHEIHANEIVLLAYYIAAINIESTYHEIVGGDYVPFEGICLTDTFQMYEKEDLVDASRVDNSARRKRQKKLDIRVIVGNPPYSGGQANANDNNANIDYPHLDRRIAATYLKDSIKGGKRSIYDAYIRSIRWAADRLRNSGVIGFVSGNGFVDRPVMDGVRKALAEEFSSVHVLDLRGDVRKNMLSRGVAGEGENIFANASMTGIAITFFVKNPHVSKRGEIFYLDIGDLSRAEKLAKLASFHSIDAMPSHSVIPDAHSDWINQRDDRFGEFIAMGNKFEKSSQAIFDGYSLGVSTNRDAWCYNFSGPSIAENIGRMIEFYNTEVRRYSEAANTSERRLDVDNFVDNDKKLISWSLGLKKKLVRSQPIRLKVDSIVPALYRPFSRQWMYFSRDVNEIVGLTPKLFPKASTTNVAICVTGVGARSGFSALVINFLPNLHTLDSGQCFPLYLYETPESDDALPPQSNLFDPKVKTIASIRRDAITSEGLAHFQSAYTGETINKEDIFYYVYGLLHSPDYRERYADNLSKELPRIPRVKTAADFWAFSRAGRDLAELHLNYETVPMYPATVSCLDGRPFDFGPAGLRSGRTEDEASLYRVEKMKFIKNGKDKDLTTLIYNAKISVTGIPLEAYDYVVNGKPALDWVVERQCVKTDKDSGIVNDANDWAIETMHNPRYPLELFLRVITVSLETMEIVRALPPLDIREN